MTQKLCNAAFYKAACDKAIASLKILKSNPKTITPEEREILLGFPGGGILKEAGIFNGDTRKWVVEKREELRSLLTPQEWESLENSGSLNAHYTKPEIVTEMWRFLKTYLQPGARVIDPGCGTGRFFLGCPEDVEYVGIDNDLISAAISKLAHPRADIVCQDFKEWKSPDVDGVIGNIPFVNGTKAFYLDDKKISIGLHAQFFIKAIGKMKDGAPLALLTSTNTLDSLGEDYIEFRQWVDKHTHFLGAIRLPAGSTHDGGTEVTTDLILLQKRKFGDRTPNPPWIKTVGSGVFEQYGEAPEEMQINEWFALNPQFVLGELGHDKLTKGHRCAVLMRQGQDVVADLRKALNKIGGIEEVGYSHRWWQPKTLDLKIFESFIKSVKRLGDATAIPLYIEENYDEGFIVINGIDDDECEDAVFEAQQETSNNWDGEKKLFKGYCKTDQRKYDRVVFASLLSFAYHFPNVKIGSDGELAEGDFADGIELFERTLGIKVEIEQPDPTRSSVPLIVRFIEPKLSKETETMTAETQTNWEAFEVKFVDKKGKEAGDAAVQIWFPVKPPKKVTEMLGKVNFRYHGNGVQYWYAYLPGEVTPEMEAKGVKTLEAFVRGLVKAYAPKGAHISQEKPKVETPAPGGGMLKMLKDMAEELKALRREVAEVKEAAGNSAEVTELKTENAVLRSELETVREVLANRGKKYDEILEEKTYLQDTLNAKLKIIDSQASTLEASTKHIAELEAALAEKDHIIAEKQQTIATAVAEVDRIDSQYQALVKSINDQGFTVEEFLGILQPQAEEDVIPIGFDDDTPAISFDSEPKAKPLEDDAGDSGDGSDPDSSGVAADSDDGFDFSGIDEAKGFDLDALNNLGGE